MIFLEFIPLAAFLIFFAFSFVYFKKKSKENQSQLSLLESEKLNFEKQKAEFEVWKTEFLNSVTNAKRIQTAVLPAKSTMDRFLDEYFIFYRPKDIVSGDFYWFEYYNCKLYIAVADCTGHGVPGAMLSLICNNALLKALYDDRSTTTGELLNNTRMHVIENLSNGKFDISDGMDISLCCIDFLEYSIEWSGANNPLWIIRNGDFVEYKPNKHSIANELAHIEFETHTIQLSEHDLIYMFSDGFKDQFGGDNNKKFLNKRFKELILEISKNPMDQQSKLFEKSLKDWMGNNEQVDDICVMGIKMIY